MLRTVLRALGLIVVFLVVFVLCVRLHRMNSSAVVFVAAALFGMAAWAGHTPESSEFAAFFGAALRKAGYSQKAAAIEMEIPEPTLTAWLKGDEQASLWRAARLSPRFWVEFSKLLVAREGDCAVIESAVICELVNAVQTLTAERRRPAAKLSEVA